ncbi:antibiotic biosynthesis monooxygenase [Geodermatophilus chilensis]|uniref:antibiotic biosynthesis monooxygenase n=1 Tax=Geodermatophilus chilensis TaxID=2035835 RepID=UPI000C26198F|nr:antibiotic biosynthesis monooxygenase [Geodermatophilus chilensis]
MPVIPDLPWTAEHVGEGPGVVMVTHLHLRRLRDVPAFLRDSLAIRAQAAAAPGARSLYLRAQPLARHFTTVSRWDDQAAVVAFVRTDPHRAAMRRRGPEMREFSNRSHPGTGTVPTVQTAAALSA